MANIREVWKTANSLGRINEEYNPIRGLPGVLKQTVSGDIAQMHQVSTSPKISGLDRLLMYAQRAVEIGYIFSEVFIRNEYGNWEPNTDSPRIIDLGGDPGMFSALYWKHKAPHAKITVIEANPVTARVMQASIARRNIEGMQVLNAAVIGRSGDIVSLNLHRPRKGWHTQDYVGGSANGNSENQYSIPVPTVALSELIEDGEEIDLLKFDIEGSEGEVIKDLNRSGKLKQIDTIIMEFHHDPVNNPQNSLQEMLNMLRKNNFDIKDAHITIGKGMRKKRRIPVANIASISSLSDKTFLTFSAVLQK